MNFLLEIGVEELPAEYARRAWHELAASRILAEALGGSTFWRLQGVERGLYTPRRLALVAGGFPARQADVEVKVTGPSRKAAFDAEGRPTRALEGFLKGQGLTLEQTHTETTPKGEYVAARVTRRGAPVKEKLEKAIPEALAALSFPRTMRWEPRGARFARPIRWIVALLDGEPLDFGYADVRPGTRTAGHRFFHPEFFDLAGLGRAREPDQLLRGYLDAVRALGVMASADERRAVIRSELRRLAGCVGGALLEDEELVDITADLVEWPAVVCGGFDPSYLQLPRETIVTAMREHQRYFAVLGQDRGLLPSFLCVANASRAYFEASAGIGRLGGPPGALGAEPARELDRVLAPIAHGNERVLRARLDDAKFYWESDLARWRKGAGLAPERQAEPLRGVAWLEGWGTVYEKAGRVARLVDEVGPDFGLDERGREALRRAAWLMKLDLTAEMIKDGKEFTSLEGRMGALYAEACGVGPEVTTPMAEHYLPRESVTEPRDRRWLTDADGVVRGGRGPGAPVADGARDAHGHGSGVAVDPGEGVRSKLPGTPAARTLALLDKLDSLAGFFAAGRIPTGSEDPFGVRRIGNGLVATLLLMEREARSSSEPAQVLRAEHIEQALRGYGERVDADKIPGLVRQIFDFLLSRLRAFLADEATEAVNAALAAGPCRAGRVFDPLDAARRARQMSRLLESELSEREREDLYGLSLLFKRVSNILKDQQLDDRTPPPETHDPQERKLLDAVAAAGGKVLESYGNQRYDAALAELLQLRAPIDQFFIDVMVMAEDPVARDRRLKLLRRIQDLFLGGWDFSQVSVPASVS